MRELGNGGGFVAGKVELCGMRWVEERDLCGITQDPNHAKSNRTVAAVLADRSIEDVSGGDDAFQAPHHAGDGFPGYLDDFLNAHTSARRHGCRASWMDCRIMSR